jgi:hypothetical protein
VVWCGVGLVSSLRRHWYPAYSSFFSVEIRISSIEYVLFMMFTSVANRFCDTVYPSVNHFFWDDTVHFEKATSTYVPAFQSHLTVAFWERGDFCERGTWIVTETTVLTALVCKNDIS